MKPRWAKLFAFLGIATASVETSATGIFLKEEDVDKMSSVHDKNVELEATIATLTAERDKAKTDLEASEATALEASTEKDNKIVQLTDGLKVANAKIAKLDGSETGATAGTAEKKLTADGKKKKMTQREVSLEKAAASMRGEKYVEPNADDIEDEEDEDGSENKE